MSETTSTTTTDTFNKLFFGSDEFNFLWTPLHWAAVGTTAVLTWPSIKKAINKASRGSAAPQSARAQARQSQENRAPVEQPVNVGVQYDD